ncbi:MAG: hypothetical protein R3229_17570 [Alphaproteobacteria bacterium]|nr:hypothetical protein [Alphaproteobacteria bacterium]
MQLAVAVFGGQFEVPVFGDVLGATETALFGAFAPFLAFEVGGAVPVAAFAAAINTDFVS